MTKGKMIIRKHPYDIFFLFSHPPLQSHGLLHPYCKSSPKVAGGGLVPARKTLFSMRADPCLSLVVLENVYGLLGLKGLYVP